MIGAKTRVYGRSSEVDFRLEDVAPVPLPNAVLFVRPTFYEIAYVINPHMEGHIGSVDRTAAERQWSEVVAAYRSIGLEVHVLDGQSGFPDMVFCANQTLPTIARDGTRAVVMSRMASKERVGEPAFFETFFSDQGYEIRTAPDIPFEGAGDALWHHDRRLLWMGTGYRSSADATSVVAQALGVPIVHLRLVDPLMYHLDTCLSILDAETALWVPSAFDDMSRELVQQLIPNPIPVPVDEAVSSLACNAHCPDGHHVVVQRGCDETRRRISAHGFEVVECETGEFIKAGGSVFCMKQMFWVT